jgi:hypothetical protein
MPVLGFFCGAPDMPAFSAMEMPIRVTLEFGRKCLASKTFSKQRCGPEEAASKLCIRRVNQKLLGVPVTMCGHYQWAAIPVGTRFRDL